MVLLAPTAKQIYVTTALRASIFAPPPDTRNAFVRFFEDNWRIIVSVLEFIIAVALIPFTAGMSLVAAVAIQVAVDVVFGVMDTLLDVLVDKQEFTGIQLLNFLPLAISAAGKGLKLVVKGLVKAGLFGVAKVGKELIDLTKGALKASDFESLNFRVLLKQKVPTFNKAGQVAFSVDYNVIKQAGAAASDKQVLLTAFRQQVYSAEAFATTINKGQVLDKGSFWYMSNVLEDEIGKSADDYSRQIAKFRKAIQQAEKVYAKAAAAGSAGTKIFNAEFKAVSADIIKYYKLVKKTIARVKYFFEIPGKIIKYAINKLVKHFKRIPAIERGLVRLENTRLGRLLAGKGRVKQPITRESVQLATKTDNLVRSLGMIPIDSDWIIGLKVRPKFVTTSNTIGAVVKIAEVGQIPDDPTWMADVFIMFDPYSTRHSGKLAGQPHERWGIVGPGEPRGKRMVKLYMSGTQLKDLLNSYSSFGNWYLTIGRNMARETTIAEIIGGIASAAGIASAQASARVANYLTRATQVLNLGLKTLKEAMYWRAQVQFVYARVLQIQNGTFFERIINPNKLRSIATRSLVSAVFRGNSFGNMAYRFGYALATNNAKGIGFLTQKTIRSYNRHHSAELKRIRGLINTGRRISSPNFVKLVKPVKVRPPSVKRYK